MKNLAKTKWFIFGAYVLLVFAVLLLGFIVMRSNNTIKNIFFQFFEVAENRTFDYRQSLRVMHKHPIPNKDIVVLAIDDASLEFLWDKYGEWPVPRNVYADAIYYIENQKPQSIIFDLMFLKSMRSSSDSDKAFVEAMNKYDNIYTGINFDNQEFDVRKPQPLPEKMALNLKNESDIKYQKGNYVFSNCRLIMRELLDGKVNVGAINITRSNDGIIRAVPLFFKYQENYYPYLGFKAAADYLRGKHDNNFVIGKKRDVVVSGTKLFLNKNGEVILNWYGPSQTHTTIPFYKVVTKQLDQFDFKDKIVIIGTTASSLHDTKSVPIQNEVYPGVEVHATVFNNMIDNNFIKKSSPVVNLSIIAGVIAIVGAIAMLSTSTIFAFLSTALFMSAYLFISYYVMDLFNLWIPVLIPVIAIIGAFTLSIIAKYLMKSKDFEYQYRLATIDGLTELYNHRYFQDALRKQIDLAQRYNHSFSLIICDIDFFKKFNDTYGHQTGDAVLRQVAQTLKKNSRTTDYVCRYGGEEMSIILPNTGSEEAMLLANRICKAVSDKPFHITPVDTAEVTISLGVATYPDNAKGAQELIEWADKGLYYAKEHGRNQVGRY